MLWLYLLGAVTVLSIALRRVLHRQTPLSDELYSTKVAFEHLQSGVAWVRADQTLGAVNASLANTLSTDAKSLVGRSWLEMFPAEERDRIAESYSAMLLAGKTEFDAYGRRADGTYAWLNVLLVAVHDHAMRFAGHHCLVLDSTHTRILEDRVKELTHEMIGSAR
jgi:PAS domain S-box-containing protein